MSGDVGGVIGMKAEDASRVLMCDRWVEGVVESGAGGIWG